MNMVIKVDICNCLELSASLINLSSLVPHCVQMVVV